jgi:hypothetical protein
MTAWALRDSPGKHLLPLLVRGHLPPLLARGHLPPLVPYAAASVPYAAISARGALGANQNGAYLRSFEGKNRG